MHNLAPSQKQIDIIRYSWERVSEIRCAGDDRNVSSAHAFGLVFYDALFELDPDAKKLFPNVYKQARALTGMISYIARAPSVTAPNLMEGATMCCPGDKSKYDEADPEWLAHQMRELGARHYFYGVHAHHLDLVGKSFVEALKRRLGDEYTDEIGDAWLKGHAYTTYHMRIGLETQRMWEMERRTATTQAASKPDACLIQ
ncbi:globin-like protein [Radiomyces spectabilis]|uniref:globin-like protein n=1 Tax=Radiomyces spectabilis TaxID=64574 RepID=UPI002220A97A|nr:globin-like protein [Radiomyces spectabilis]KAI8379636.1 globin-like protein [Radiomyces spectabilis]